MPTAFPLRRGLTSLRFVHDVTVDFDQLQPRTLATGSEMLQIPTMSRSLFRCFVPFGMSVFLAACAGSPGQGSTDAGDAGNDVDSGTTLGLVPTDSTAAAIRAFLDAKTYQGPEWVAETAAPRPESSGVSPHDDVRVFLN